MEWHGKGDKDSSRRVLIAQHKLMSASLGKTDGLNAVVGLDVEPVG